MTETWKDIPGYEGLYQISNMGRVKSLGNGKSNNSKEKILNSYKNKYGYIQVSLCIDGKMKTHLMHRLVAQAFLDNPKNLPEINHVDENKQNNCLDNLEYCDRKYNNNYGNRNERISKSILQFTKEGEFVRSWDSATQIKKELGFDNGGISKCCKGKKKTCGGYIWHYHYKSLWKKNYIPLKDRKVA